MSRLYTGQHGEFFFWVQDGLFGSTENFRIDQKGGARGIEHTIQRLGTSCKEGTVAIQHEINATKLVATAWERAGWVSGLASDDFPGLWVKTLSLLTATRRNFPKWLGLEAKSPLAKINIPGNYRRIGTVRNWSFSNTAETIDTTTLGDTYRDKVAWPEEHHWSGPVDVLPGQRRH